ncbi:MAG: DNA (cytosine-5-)-methyltransferase [Bifidobacteriaceae bacterium]|nr:DNA (cytosine-5-)-methyltransferase [Bifidobacteriaceae bacterium]
MGPVGGFDRDGADEPRALEFFAGIGLARCGLEAAGFRVVWSNDCDQAKHETHAIHFGEDAGREYAVGDIGDVKGNDLPPGAALSWASSPCTDLSLAGGRAGLSGAKSGVFWEHIRVLRELGDGKPPVAVLENVVGLATSHGGDDMASAIRAFNALGYSVDILAIDARRFVPQSRPRLFLVAAARPPADCGQAGELRPDWLRRFFTDPTLRTHRAALPAAPALLASGLSVCVDDLPLTDKRWWGRAKTQAFEASLSAIQRGRIEALKRSPGVFYRTAYRRTRDGKAVWETRPDDIAGCLRTARGGSSRQALARIGDGDLRVRWMTPHEYAVLMGVGHYTLDPARVTQNLSGFGDAVAAPVVEWLARHYLRPLVDGRWGEPSRQLVEIALF